MTRENSYLFLLLLSFPLFLLTLLSFLYCFSTSAFYHSVHFFLGSIPLSEYERRLYLFITYASYVDRALCERRKFLPHQFGLNIQRIIMSFKREKTGQNPNNIASQKITFTDDLNLFEVTCNKVF